MSCRSLLLACCLPAPPPRRTEGMNESKKEGSRAEWFEKSAPPRRTSFGNEHKQSWYDIDTPSLTVSYRYTAHNVTRNTTVQTKTLCSSTVHSRIVSTNPPFPK